MSGAEPAAAPNGSAQSAPGWALLRRSLRLRLAVWHAAVLGLALVALAALTYGLLVRMLHSRADASLLAYADTVARRIAGVLMQAEVARRPPEPFLENDVRSWGRYVQVVDPRGAIVARSDALASHPLPVSPEIRLRALRGETCFEVITGLGEHPVRVVTVPVRLGDRVAYLVQAGVSLEGVEATLHRVAMILLVLTPSAFLVALLGGWSLVGRALRPVEQLTRAALERESRNLSEPLVAPASDDEIGQLARAFGQMLARLDRSFRQMRQFSVDASHELRTPLTTIRGEAEVALMNARTPEQYRRALRAILAEAERMSEIVEDLLLLARAEGEGGALEREPVALEEVALAACEALERTAAEKGIRLEIELGEELVVHGDRLWLRQLVLNLVGNAIQYTPAGGRVSVALARDGDRARLTVADTGVGIAPEHLPAIFDRFYRVDPGRSRGTGGAGLGLSIARWVVEAHGGSIAAASEPGRGTEFTVLLPLAQAPTT